MWLVMNARRWYERVKSMDKNRLVKIPSECCDRRRGEEEGGWIMSRLHEKEFI